MDLYDVFDIPFKLNYHHTYQDPVPKYHTYFKTENIFGETTKEEIYALSKMYLDLLIRQYKDFNIGNIPTTESTYRLAVELFEDGEIKNKLIYSCSYDNIQDRVTWENKFDDNFDIEGEFFVSIDITAMVITDYDTEEEDDEYIRLRKTITETECIICFENKPNMLYLECLHLCVCNVCDTKGKFYKCPMCRTKIKNQKIRIT